MEINDWGYEFLCVSLQFSLRLCPTEKLGLITKLECEESTVTKANGDSFMAQVVEEKVEEEPPAAEDADELVWLETIFFYIR